MQFENDKFIIALDICRKIKSLGLNKNNYEAEFARRYKERTGDDDGLAVLDAFSKMI